MGVMGDLPLVDRRSPFSFFFLPTALTLSHATLFFVPSLIYGHCHRSRFCLLYTY
ncbi:hypothetical protein BDV06DRAFT_195193 [Aspergillus oleicola]